MVQRMFDLKLVLENRALINQIPNIASSRDQELFTECWVFQLAPDFGVWCIWKCYPDCFCIEPLQNGLLDK